MAERNGEKRKLKKRFLVISKVSKFIKKNGWRIIFLILGLVILVLVLAPHFEPEPEPEPGWFDKVKLAAAGTKESVISFFGEVASGAKGVWGSVSSFFTGLFK